MNNSPKINFNIPDENFSSQFLASFSQAYFASQDQSTSLGEELPQEMEENSPPEFVQAEQERDDSELRLAQNQQDLVQRTSERESGSRDQYSTSSARLVDRPLAGPTSANSSTLDALLDEERNLVAKVATVRDRIASIRKLEREAMEGQTPKPAIGIKARDADGSALGTPGHTDESNDRRSEIES